MPKFLARFTDYLRSDKFYRLVIIVFILEAAWIAISAAYPQAFDENFHFGLIKIYSHYWLPFISHQPPHADAYGAVARDPSYLYHYLMSFPYRLVELFTKRQMAQVIILRFINIALFSWGIILFRRLLIRVGASKALSNLILMLFILIPIVPQLAAQINYDNLMIPLTALSLLLAFRLIDEIKAKKPSLWTISLLSGLGFLTALVKYAYLPIFAGMVIFLLVYAFRTYRRSIRSFFRQLLRSWQSYSWIKRAFIAMAIVIPLGMFVQRDMVNLAVYHSIQPSCGKVLSVKQCMAYSPWAYNYKNHAKLTAPGSNISLTNPLFYAFEWLYWMWYRLFFAVNGPGSNFRNYPPLPLPSAAALLLVIAGVIALIKWWRKIFSGNLRLMLLMSVTVAYLVALFAQGYFTYRYTAVLENMNGRYLLPVLILAAVIFGQAISMALANKQRRKAVFALLALLFFLEGGGVITFIARSDPSWNIDNKAIVKVNNAARKVVKNVVVKGKKSYSTRVWFFN